MALSHTNYEKMAEQVLAAVGALEDGAQCCRGVGAVVRIMRDEAAPWNRHRLTHGRLRFWQAYLEGAEDFCEPYADALRAARLALLPETEEEEEAAA